MPRKSYQPVELVQAVRDLVLKGYSPSQIYKHLEAQKCFKPMPTLRTIQRMVKEIAPPDLSEEWSLADAEPEDARFVLDLLAVLTRVSEGRTTLSRAMAEWALKVRKAAPSLPIYRTYEFAMEYRRQMEQRESTRDLDLFLALTPWESTDDADAYENLLHLGVMQPPLYLGRWYRHVMRGEVKQ